MKNSKQRTLIETTVKHSKTHPNADEIYNLLKPTNPKLSLGTVYRNLNLLVGLGIINKLVITTDSDRFDAKTSSHSHFICEQCGKIMDIDTPISKQLLGDIVKQTDIIISSCQLIINGKCKQCKRHLI